MTRREEEQEPGTGEGKLTSRGKTKTFAPQVAELEDVVRAPFFMCCILLLCPLPDAAASGGACLIIISDWRGRTDGVSGGDRQSLLRMGIRLGFVRGRRDGRHRARLGRRRRHRPSSLSAP